MKEFLFCVYFKNGIQDHWNAHSAVEAAILAMAKAIESGRDFNVSFVENLETGEKTQINLTIDTINEVTK